MKLLCVSCVRELSAETSMFPDSVMVGPCPNCIEIWRKENIGKYDKERHIQIGRESAFDLMVRFIKTQGECEEDEKDAKEH